MIHLVSIRMYHIYRANLSYILLTEMRKAAVAFRRAFRLRVDH